MRFILLACLLGCVLLPARGDVYVDSLDIAKYQNSTDTMWIVNKGFTDGDVQTRHVELKLLLKNCPSGFPTTGQVECQQIDTETGEKTIISNSGWPFTFSQLTDTLRFPSLDKGVYLLTFTFGSGTDSPRISCYLFNQRLDFRIIDALVPEGTVQGDDCITGEQDTCYFTLRGHYFHPAGTEYKMDVNDDLDGDVVVGTKKDSRDTFFVIFNGPTGINELRLAVKGTYKDDRDGREISRTISRERTLQKYSAPDLAKIFGFDTLVPDHLAGCSENGALFGFSFSKDMEERYMYANNEPNFTTVPKLKYTIKYYRRDFQHGKNGENLAWSEDNLINEAEKEACISDSANISFLQSGIYRVWMTAENRCGKDTLDTKVIFDEETHKPIIANPDTGRLIKIFRNDTRDLMFKQSFLCLEDKGNGILCDTLVVKDSARYLDWEGHPEYDFIVKQIIQNAEGQESIVDLPEDDLGSYYRKGNPKSFSGADVRITDSTILKLVFYKAGLYEVVVKKTRENVACTPEVFDTLRLRVGAVPTLDPEILRDNEGTPKEGQTFCGEYEYTVPTALKIDSNYCALTGFAWAFGKGTHEEKSDKRFPDSPTFVFDSLNGAPSYIKLRVQNQCGWSEEAAVNFSTHKALKNIQLWIDSIPGNDYLCAGREYKYHFKGNLPESFEIYGFGGSDEFETDSIIEYRHSEVERFSNTYIVKDAKSSCEQKINVKIDFIAPPAFAFEDIVDFCSSEQEIKTSLLLKEQPEDLDDLVYERIYWKTIQPEDLSLADDIELEGSLQKDFPKFTVPDGEKTVLYYWITAGGGGDYSRYQGCYDTGHIELTRHLLPTFELKKQELANLCAKEIDTKDLFEESIAGSSSWSIDVNGMMTTGRQGNDMPIYTVQIEDDSIKMAVSAVVELQHPYGGGAQCEISDAAAWDIRNPRIRILKEDTLFAADRIYRFEQIKKYVDTADIYDFHWKKLDSDNGAVIENSEDLFGATCDFKNLTPGRNYNFALVGKSLCDDKELEGRLSVYYPVIDFSGGSVAICDNVESYSLWSDIKDDKHINGYFIKEETLHYSIRDNADGSKGSIEEQGKKAVYRLPEVWTSELSNGRYVVYIDAGVEDETGVSKQATLTLYVWPAPRMSLKQNIVLQDDELILAKGDKLDFDEVADFKDAYHIKWYHGEESLNDEYIPAYSGFKAYRDSIRVEMSVSNTNTGCKSPFYDTLALFIHPTPRVVFKPTSITICPNGKETITPREPASEDGGDWTYKWTSQINPSVNSNTSLALDYSYAEGDDFGFDTLSLTVTKQVTNYKGEQKELKAIDSVVVINRRKPQIFGEDAMICSGNTEIDIRDMEIRTPYDDALIYMPQSGLEATVAANSYRFTGDAGTEAILKVSLQNQICPDDAGVSRDFTIRRLPVLSAVVTPEKASICEGDPLQLNAVMGSEGTRYEWSATQGGTFQDKETLTPVFISKSGVSKDTVVLTLVPEFEGCVEDRQEYRVPVEIGTIPHDLWQTEFSVCATEENFLIKPVQASAQDLLSMFSKIEWEYKGEVFSSEYIPVFEMEKLDPSIRKDGGTITITAKAWLTCNPNRDPMTVDLKATIAPEPKVNIGTIAQPVCQGEPLMMDFVTFAHASTWKWSAVRGAFDDDKIEHPEFSSDDYGMDPGIQVTAGNGGACSDVTVDIPIGEILEAPELSIVQGPACLGEEMKVWSASENVGSYIWNMDGGSAQTEPIATYTFNDLKEHVISLEVKYINGCVKSASKPVQVYANPEAKLEIPTLVGVLTPVTIKSLSDDDLDLKWYVNDKPMGNASPFDYTFVNEGEYRVKLVVENEHGCSDAAETSVRVIRTPKPDFEVWLQNPCDSIPQFRNNTSVADDFKPKYTWLLGTEDTESVDIHGEVPGGEVRYARDFGKRTYDIGLVLETVGGKDTVWKQLTVESRLQASIVRDDNALAACPGREYTFINRTRGDVTNYRIEWGDGVEEIFSQKVPLKHVYTNDETNSKMITVKLYAKNACFNDEAFVDVSIAPKVEASLGRLTVGDICFGEEVQFENTSENLDKLVVFWNFGDSPSLENGNAQYVSHTFKEPGDYKVTMVIGDENGCGRDTAFADVHIKGKRLLPFVKSAEVVCSGQEMTFKVAEDILGEFANYEWCLDYRQTSNANTWKPDGGDAKITQQWNGVLNTVVALRAQSVDGCTDVYSEPVEVKRATPAHWEFRNGSEGAYFSEENEIHGCSPLNLNLNAIGTNASDMVRWDFYDGASSTDKQTVHSYRSAGNTFVKLTVTTRDGCIDSLKKEVTVKRTPRAEFVNTPGDIFCVDGIVRINVENSITSAGDTAYSWTYLRPGATVYEAWSDAFLPEPMEWDNMFGEVVLRLRAAWGGCEMEYRDTLISSPAPGNQFSLSATEVCEEVPVEFHCEALPDTRFSWNLGDNSPERTDSEFRYFYDVHGLYPVTLHIENQYGCEKDTTWNLKVYPLPEADFDFIPDPAVIEGLPEGVDISLLPEVNNGGFRFTNHSSVFDVPFADATLFSHWDMGDGTVFDVTELNHRFPNNGNYTVKLRVTTKYGCADSLEQVVSVEEIKGLYIPNAFAPIAGKEENPGVALFQPKGVGLLSYEIRVYDNPSGTCVWKSNALEDGRPAEAWDGTFNGQPLPGKVYLWEVRAVFRDGTIWKDEKGNTRGMVTLVR